MRFLREAGFFVLYLPFVNTPWYRWELRRCFKYDWEGPTFMLGSNGWRLLINIDGVFIGMAVGLNNSEGSGRRMGVPFSSTANWTCKSLPCGRWNAAMSNGYGVSKKSNRTEPWQSEIMSHNGVSRGGSISPHEHGRVATAHWLARDMISA